MAFIREYMAAGDPGRMRDFMAGDPGRRRGGFFRKLRKMKFGGLARAAVGFVPGVGPLASRVLQMAGDPYDDEEGFDYIGDPGRKQPKRKSAAAGPKAKAARKRQGRKKGRGGKRPSGASLDFGKLAEAAIGAIPIAGGVAQELLHQVRQGGEEGEAAAAELIPHLNGAGMLPRMPKGKRFRGFGGGHHRCMNPANVKALRRGLRRIEGFEKLVKRVHKAFPRLVAAGARASHGGGHKSGCKCFGCRKRAA